MAPKFVTLPVFIFIFTGNSIIYEKISNIKQVVSKFVHKLGNLGMLKVLKIINF